MLPLAWKPICGLIWAFVYNIPFFGQTLQLDFQICSLVSVSFPLWASWGHAHLTKPWASAWFFTTIFLELHRFVYNLKPQNEILVPGIYLWVYGHVSPLTSVVCIFLEPVAFPLSYIAPSLLIHTSRNQAWVVILFLLNTVNYWLCPYAKEKNYLF